LGAIGIDPDHGFLGKKMSISVKYFASIRERLGRDEERIDASGITTAADVWQQATGEGWPASMLVAINQEYADREKAVCDGDEVAFFPPVTGG
jgi:molybdopterin synthase sulfur carrier subunit